MSNVPSWWQFALLAGAAYRSWRLLALDKVTDRLRLRAVGLHQWSSGEELPAGFRAGVAAFVQCPWCSGFWIAAGWWAGWVAWPHTTLIAAGLFALSTVVGFLARFEE